jgi:hypothetical protein
MDFGAILSSLATPGALALGAGLMKVYERYSTSRKEQAEREAAERKATADRELAEDAAERKHAMDLGAALSAGAVVQERLSANVASLVSGIEGLRGELSGHNRTISEIDARGARLEASGTERGERMRSVVEEHRASSARVEQMLLSLTADMREVLALLRAGAAAPPTRAGGRAPASPPTPPAAVPTTIPPTPPASPAPTTVSSSPTPGDVR